MYYYEDRMRAVALYIKLGKRAKATYSPAGLSKQECISDDDFNYSHLPISPQAGRFYRGRTFVVSQALVC